MTGRGGVRCFTGNAPGSSALPQGPPQSAQALSGSPGSRERVAQILRVRVPRPGKTVDVGDGIPAAEHGRREPVQVLPEDEVLAPLLEEERHVGLSTHWSKTGISTPVRPRRDGTGGRTGYRWRVDVAETNREVVRNSRLSPTTAIVRPVRFCWWRMFRSVVRNTSKPALSAASSSSPFARVCPSHGNGPLRRHDPPRPSRSLWAYRCRRARVSPSLVIRARARPGFWRRTRAPP